MLQVLVNTLFDEIRNRHQLTSDAALAKYLSAAAGEKVSEMAIHRWRRGHYPKGLDVLGPQLIEYADTLRHQAA
jgi:hypothetical protein